jgi:hypothetical protein
VKASTEPYPPPSSDHHQVASYAAAAGREDSTTSISVLDRAASDPHITRIICFEYFEMKQSESGSLFFKRFISPEEFENGFDRRGSGL